MKKELKVEMGQRVKVANKQQINYPKRGTIVARTTEPNGLKMSKVRFITAECWYYDDDLKPVRITKDEREAAQQYQEIVESRGMRIARLTCPACKTSFDAVVDLLETTHVPCGSAMCNKAVNVRMDRFEAGEDAMRVMRSSRQKQ